MENLLRIGLAALALLLAVSSSAIASEFPTRPVKIVAGNQPGGPTDTIARLVADALAEAWGAPVVVENRSGAGGTIAAEMVANAAPDGYTLLVGGPSNLTAAPAVYPDLRYDPLRDFVPVARVAAVPFVIAIAGRIDARSVPELVTLARNRPGAITYASLGRGTFSTLPLYALESRYDIRMLEVPYSGSATLLNDFIAGRIDVIVSDLARLRPHAAKGTIRMLATVGGQRPPTQQDLPTLADQGIDGIVVESWYGLLAPSATPHTVVARLSSSLRQVLRNPAMHRRLLALDYVPIDESSDDFRSAMALQALQVSALVRGRDAKEKR